MQPTQKAARFNKTGRSKIKRAKIKLTNLAKQFNFTLTPFIKRYKVMRFFFLARPTFMSKTIDCYDQNAEIFQQ
jgi:hypothetical protein